MSNFPLSDGGDDSLGERDKVLRLYKNMGGCILEVNPEAIR